ncbi:MAG: CBS domain-containing protein [Candidatus Manganitrophaceae bacterium]|nr:MAG: CBS domain-containing protein [Candidatus Manganitrophaceae bacterium]
MFGKRITLFKLFGFAVHIDMSWIIIALLVTWSLAAGLFPVEYRGLSPATYWIMGIVGALGLFGSIVFHEMSHSLVARRFGIPMKGITLFIFGGVAEMDDEPPSPRAEFWMAIAGPLSSIFLAAAFYGFYIFGERSGWPAPVDGVLGYLGVINAILAVFNLVPAFPLDGGRVLRSILWGWRNDLRWGTRISSTIGSGFGLFLIFVGVLNALRGNFIGGVWQFLIGMFLRDAARMSYQQLLARQALEGERVRRFMQTDPIVVSPFITLAQLIEDYVYRHQFKLFPVVRNGELVGCIDLNQVKEIPRNEWPSRTVGEVAGTCSVDNTISPDADAVKALSKMSRTGRSRLLVVDRGKLVGILSLRDLLRFLSLKIELENGEPVRGPERGPVIERDRPRKAA